jgi:hypothetical protein
VEIECRTITDYLQCRRWSKKVVKARAAERNEPLRAAFRGLQPFWDDDQLVFLDESAANERTGDRKMGWSLVGVECMVAWPLKRSER